MKNTILGAIAGDIIGSVYEWNNYKGKDFLLLNSQCRFTDDTVMTVAVADALMTEKDVARTLQQWGRKYPGRGYGGLFRKWLTMEKPEPYHSYGNGSAMRVSAAGCMAKSISEAEELAVKSAEVTHNHPEGLKGAKAVAAAVYFAKIGAEYRKILTNLFDESKEISERIVELDNQMNQLYKTVVSNRSHHHDERTASTLLVYKYPEKYTLYKDSFYKKFCKLTGVIPEKKGHKYLHYQGLVDDFIDDYLKTDLDLLKTVRNLLPENAFSDDDHRILAQDIFFRMLDQDIMEIDITDHNVFKVSMGEFSLEDFNSYVNNNLILVHQDTASKGISNLTQAENFKDEMQKGDYFYLTYGNNKSGVRLIGRVTSDYRTREDGWLEREFEPVALSRNTSKYTKINKWWTPNNNSTFIKIKPSEIKEANKLIFEPYFMTTLVNETTDDAAEQEDEEQTAFAGDEITDFTEVKNLNIPLNQILFGAPGTGKTYHTVNRAVAIIENKSDAQISTELLTSGRKDLTRRFNDYVKDGRIVFTTFHQSMGYEDFIEGIKPETNENDQVIYKVESGIFKQIADKARSKKKAHNFDEVYTKMIDDMRNGNEEYLELTTIKGKKYNVFPNKNNNLNLYTSSNKNHSGVLTKERLKEFSMGQNPFQGWEGYANGVIDHLKIKYGLAVEMKNQNEKYVIIIDEINRGNVSAIFGELITLIEFDKRLGNSEQLEVILPYSKEPFGVPSNLYLIGTMNTADRSVEALDTALRRRFSFIEMRPDISVLLDSKYKEVDLSKLLDIINRRIELLIDKDHQIGHSYFIGVQTLSDLQMVFKNKIIPLLEEYFYGDFGKIGLVLGDRFVEVQDQKENKNLLFKLKGYDDVDFLTDRKIWTIKNMEDLSAADFISVYSTSPSDNFYD